MGDAAASGRRSFCCAPALFSRRRVRCGSFSFGVIPRREEGKETMQKAITVTAVTASLAALLFVAGCGESKSTRVLTGAAGGAAAGQVVAGAPLAGAAAGGVAGALRP